MRLNGRGVSSAFEVPGGLSLGLLVFDGIKLGLEGMEYWVWLCLLALWTKGHRCLHSDLLLKENAWPRSRQ
jgi:hypothetical protein